MKMHFFVKITADQRQLFTGASVSLQTCDKSFLGFLEVNFDERKKNKIILVLLMFLRIVQKVNF